MKNICFFLLGLIVISSQYLFAQEKQLSIEDAVVGLYTKLAPTRIANLAWIPGSDNLSFVKGNALWKNDFINSEEKLLIDSKTLNKQLAKLKQDSLKAFPIIEWNEANSFTFRHNGSVFIYDFNDKELELMIKLPENAENIEIAPYNTYAAYTVGNNLNIIDRSKIEKYISNDRELGIVYGTSVHRNEFGIDKGIFWSPEGNLIAFYRKDESMVSDYPLVDITQRVATEESIKYPMAGMKSEEVTVGIYNIASGKIIYLETGKPAEQYLTNIAWSPDEKTVYIAVLNREQNHLCLNAYDSQTGKFIKTLFEEKNTKYVEPLQPMMFIPGSEDKFLWQTRRDGYNHIYLYNTEGKLLSQITKGNWEITNLYSITNDGKNLFVQANKEQAIGFDLYKISLPDGKMTRLSHESGSHNALVHPQGTYIVDIFSSTTNPTQFDIVNSEGNIVKTLLKSENPLSEYRMGQTLIGKIKAADDSTDLYYRIILPPDFDKNKKYPCVVYVYGGPHAQLVTNRWLGGAAGWDYFMAQNGYIMFTLDNRGSSNRGLKFESVIHRNLGVAEMADQMQGIDILRNLGYVDMNRIGVHGWSYGGFLTISLMVNHGDVFKTAVAGGPVIDWKYYEVMYGERYMDTPEENPDGYAQASLLNKTDSIKGRLLVVHGAIDNTVVWQHSLAFLNACVKNGILVDYFVYPRHEHNVRGTDRIHLMRMVTRYFDDNLK